MNTTRIVLVAGVLGCGGSGSAAVGAGEPQGFEPPIAINAETPVEYPLALFNDGIEGTVMLRLYIDANGVLVPDSTRIAEGSGHAAFDSAALAGASAFRFAPARRDGVPVATAFVQPIHFRHPTQGSGGSQ